MARRSALLLFAGLLMNTPLDAQPLDLSPVPPTAKRVPHERVLHGERFVDDWFWLREKGDPAVTAHLEAENAYAEAVMKPLAPFRDALYQEMLGRIVETDLSVPYRKGGWWYYSRTEEGKQYPLHCRKRGSLEAPEEVVLDLNAFGAEHRFVGLGDYAVSDDGRLLAYSLDTTGFRQYTLHVKDLVTGAHGPEAIAKSANVTWAADGRTLFYTVEDAAKRQHRLYRHTLGEPSDRDVLVYEETDERFGLGCGRTRSRGWIVLTSASATTSEVRVLRADRPGDAFTLVEPRRDGIEYDLDHHGERFWIRANDAGRNFRLVSAPVGTPGAAHWREEVGHRPAVMLEDLDLFAGHRVLWIREGGLEQAEITDLASGATHRIAFPEPAYTLAPGDNAEFDTPLLRYRYASFVTPLSVFDHDMTARADALLKRTPVKGDFDPARYVVERLTATAADGAAIPISLVRPRTARRDGSGPLLLYGYGAYGISMSAGFNSNRLSLLDRGVSFAIAHVRGGGELGKPWHDAGRMAAKPNTFADFIACAEHLVRERLTASDRLLIQGGSAGGLLMGAVLNLRPELFRAALVQVPFVDVINSMSDASLPLTVGEFEEWGNPQVKAEYDVMRAYSPYDNVAERPYPAMLVKTSLNDSQVMYWEPAKYVARLRALRTPPRPLLLHTHMAGGHGGVSGRYDALRDAAFDYAFLLSQVGVTR
jgi:oligopeptidase B